VSTNQSRFSLSFYNFALVTAIASATCRSLLFVLSVVNAYVVAILGVNLHNRCLTIKKGCTATVAKHTERANVSMPGLA